MPFNTQAFVLDKVDAPFTLKTIELNDPLDTEVLVEIVACGLCQPNPPAFIPRLLELYKTGRFPVDQISKVFSHTQINDAIHAVHDGSVIKPIISFQ